LPTSPASAPWFNTADYSPALLVLFAVGCLGWVVSYVGVLKTVRRYQFVEIPAGAVVANVAWEFVWGFLYTSDMGMFFAWGYRLWFFLDVFIVFELFRHGWKQLDSTLLLPLFRPGAAFGILAWAVGLYYFVGEGYDTGYGAISGYILNVMMSALYIVLIAKHADDIQYFSGLVAWSKMLGTALLSVFNFIHRPDDYLLMTLYTVTFILDVLYIYVYYALRQRGPRARRVAA
jgi:hypothetical protein